MTDPTITIAGLRAQITSLSDACRALGADCVESIAQANSARAGLAAVTAERDALAAQLAEVRAELAAARHVGTDLGIALDELRSERAHLAACKERIAGMERAADERSGEVARLTAERDQARHDDQQSLSTWLRLLKAIDPKAESTDDALRVVSRLTARVAELEARPVLDVGRLATALNQCELGPRASDIMRHLGPVTLPLPAQDRADELADALFKTGNVRRALASLGAPPTSPTVAPPEVFAGVSVEDLRASYDVGYGDCKCGPGTPDYCCELNGIRAVLARLKVATIAPVNPEEVAKAYHDDSRAAAPEWDEAANWICTDNGIENTIAAMRAALAAAGVPVTPEVGK